MKAIDTSDNMQKSMDCMSEVLFSNQNIVLL